MRNRLAACVLVLSVLGLAPDAIAQSPTLITSISYQQNKTATAATLDVHVGVIQPGSAGYPCVGPNTLAVTPLPFQNEDVTSIDGKADVNPDHLKPQPEPGGYVYQIPVGKDLPTGWETVTLRISAYCTGSNPPLTPTAFVLRRYASASSLQVDADPPEWNRSGSQDTLSLVIKSNWPTSIHNLIIRENGPGTGTNGNGVNDPPYQDSVDSFTHNITVKTVQQLKPHMKYTYDVSFRSGDVNASPSTPLTAFILGDGPNRDFVLTQPPSPSQLIVRDNSQDFKFTAQTSDPGTLNAIFDGLRINGSDTVVGVAPTDGNTYIFTIPKEFLQTDGQYSFHFDGGRKNPNQTLADKHPSTLIVQAHSTLSGPIGLGLSKDNSSLVVTYCLSQQTTNVVRVSNDPTKFSVQGPGNPTKEDIGCKNGMSAYTSSIPLASFKLPDPNTKPATIAPTNAGASASSPSQLPLQLNIVDSTRSSTDPAAVLATLNITGVILPSGANTAAITDAITKLQDKNQKDSATKTLLANGVTQDTINALAKIGNKNGAASTVGAILGQVGKSFITTYFGIPAGPATSAPAATVAAQ